MCHESVYTWDFEVVDPVIMLELQPILDPGGGICLSRRRSWLTEDSRDPEAQSLEFVRA